MSIKVMSCVWDNGPKDPTERLVMLALADFCDDGGNCFPSMIGIAEKACVTERGARGIVRRLEAEGWLSVNIGGGRGGKNRYHLNLNKLGTKNPEPETGNDENPERGDTKPGTSLHKTRNQGSAEPSRTINKPSLGRFHRFDEFWNSYPHRGGVKKNRKGAEAKYQQAVRSGVHEQDIIDGVSRMRSDPVVQRGFARDPATWLNQRGWEDEITPQLRAVGGYSSKWGKL